MLIDTDTARNVIDGALDMAHAIRRDYPWAKSADSPRRYRAIFADCHANLLPRCDVVTAAMVLALINDELSKGVAIGL